VITYVPYLSALEMSHTQYKAQCKCSIYSTSCAETRHDDSLIVKIGPPVWAEREPNDEVKKGISGDVTRAFTLHTETAAVQEFFSGPKMQGVWVRGVPKET